MAGESCLILRGDKLDLRIFDETDITADYTRWLNDPEVVRFSNQRFRRHDRASCLAYLRSFEGTDNLFFSARLRATDQAVGTLTAYISRHHGTADVGIMIGERSAWGQGVGQDAWNTLCTWLVSVRGIRKLTAGTLDCNLAMIRIMERAGMHREAVRRNQELVDGQPHDVLYFAQFAGA
jgi:ribosomal-protein-alanine N-acetyltransferase